MKPEQKLPPHTSHYILRVMVWEAQLRVVGVPGVPGVPGPFGVFGVFGVLGVVRVVRVVQIVLAS